jgi:AAA+ ATPase superfamily predicted ATPase
MKKENPFLIKGYMSENLFCDRQKETLDLYNNAQNGINTTLISPRRIGKTGLIFHFFNFLSRQTDLPAIYMDIYAARSLNDFIKLL